jgi:hypothetical protein
MILKKIIFIILTLFMLSWAVSPAFAIGEFAVNKDGVQILNLGQTTISNNGVIEAGRSSDESQVQSISFYNQSTIVQQQVGAYYRTVAYEMALADINKNLITEYKDYNYNPYRQAVYRLSCVNGSKTITLPFGKPYASEEILVQGILAPALHS